MKKQKVRRLNKRKTNILKTKHRRVAKKKDEITSDMTIYQAMRMRPDSVGKLLNMGMGCGGCQFAMMETIEQGAMIHGLDVEKVLKELNM